MYANKSFEIFALNIILLKLLIFKIKISVTYLLLVRGIWE